MDAVDASAPATSAASEAAPRLSEDAGTVTLTHERARAESAASSSSDSGSDDSASDSSSSGDGGSSDDSSSGSSDSSSASSDTDAAAAAARGRSLAQRRKRLMRPKLARRYADDAARESDGEGGSVETGEEDSGAESPGNRGAAGYEVDGVVVADDDVSAGSVAADSDSATDSDSGVDSGDTASTGRSAKPRRLKRMGDRGMLEDDDYALLAEAAERGDVQLQGSALESESASTARRVACWRTRARYPHE